jgi:tRNA-binding EMAP/Myf-like protein
VASSGRLSAAVGFRIYLHIPSKRDLLISHGVHKSKHKKRFVCGFVEHVAEMTMIGAVVGVLAGVLLRVMYSKRP